MHQYYQGELTVIELFDSLQKSLQMLILLCHYLVRKGNNTTAICNTLAHLAITGVVQPELALVHTAKNSSVFLVRVESSATYVWLITSRIHNNI